MQEKLEKIFSPTTIGPMQFLTSYLVYFYILVLTTIPLFERSNNVFYSYKGWKISEGVFNLVPILKKPKPNH